MLKSTTLPFSGFYNSLHDSQLDYALETIFSNDRCDVYKSLMDKAFESIDWQSVHKHYSKDYVKAFANEFNLSTLVFEDLDSPKYYNYATDRIFCKIELSEIQDIFNRVDKIELNKHIKQRFTSCDGFISHYKNSLEAWPSDLAEWDHNQVGTLLEVFAAQESCGEFDQYKEVALLESCDNSYSIVHNNIKDDRLLNIVSYLHKREQRQYRNNSLE